MPAPPPPRVGEFFGCVHYLTSSRLLRMQLLDPQFRMQLLTQVPALPKKSLFLLLRLLPILLLVLLLNAHTTKYSYSYSYYHTYQYRPPAPTHNT